MLREGSPAAIAACQGASYIKTIKHKNKIKHKLFTTKSTVVYNIQQVNRF